MRELRRADWRCGWPLKRTIAYARRWAYWWTEFHLFDPRDPCKSCIVDERGVGYPMGYPPQENTPAIIISPQGVGVHRSELPASPELGEGYWPWSAILAMSDAEDVDDQLSLL